MTVTLLGTGGRTVEFERIGFGSEVVTVRWHGGLTRAQLEQLGGRRFTTRSITLTTEASVTITVADNLTRSTLRAN